MERMIFINLPTRDLAASDAFYSGLGFSKNADFSNEMASSWMITENSWIMILSEDFYSTFLRNGDIPAYGDGGREVLNAISGESRDEVDEFAARALAHGGTIYRAATEEMPGMYSVAFLDPDGHEWEVGWMDMSNFAAAPTTD
ncbi:lactoylglutathione lyase [Arthrobacter sp. MYb227]|uniref:VOC family protein n=1 Tax=Arthrobacter sp. MYb227 TaxID=1848601 RepID=UPI000CFDF45B|nr:VOC family protein [Arthrobacter sp. MYb227]PQZ94646.1 lactoylglutathione lyase [Arthrobacter sp. MYb227]